MKNILTALLVVVVLVLAVGVASYATKVDVDYVIGTWHHTSLLAVAAVVAGLLLVVGILSALVAGLAHARERRVLEAELERTYVRLRAAEASLAQARTAQGGPSTDPAAAGAAEPATVAAPPADAPPADAGQKSSRDHPDGAP